MSLHLELGDDALEPGLTKADRAVLAAITECGPDEWTKRELGMAATIWQVAEALDTEDLADLRRTLDGLEQWGIHLDGPICGTPWGTDKESPRQRSNAPGHDTRRNP